MFRFLSTCDGYPVVSGLFLFSIVAFVPLGHVTLICCGTNCNLALCTPSWELWFSPRCSRAQSGLCPCCGHLIPSLQLYSFTMIRDVEPLWEVERCYCEKQGSALKFSLKFFGICCQNPLWAVCLCLARVLNFHFLLGRN